MKSGLDFKRGPFFSALKPGSNNTLLVVQERTSHNEVARISQESMRWEHVKNFANGHQTVLPDECRKFYSNNPDVFHKEKRSLKKTAMICSVLSVVGFYVGLPIDLNHFPDDLKIVMLHSMAIAVGCLFLIGTCYFGAHWLNMKIGSVEKLEKPSRLFLGMFENDKNLRALWVRPSEKNGGWLQSLLTWAHPNNELKDKDLFTKDYPQLAQERAQINAYQETRAWLSQWSRGDERHLHWVEWKTLYGITQRYREHLTPVE